MGAEVAMARRDHLGRLLDHVHLVVRDLPASRRFYEAALAALGRERAYIRGQRAYGRAPHNK